MSNRELLERCQKFLEGVETEYESHEEHGLYILVEDIQAELSKPSQSEELNLAEYWKREFDELKSKLAEAEKDAFYFQFMLENDFFGEDRDYMDEAFMYTGFRLIGEGKTVREALNRMIAEKTTFNNTKELG